MMFRAALAINDTSSSGVLSGMTLSRSRIELSCSKIFSNSFSSIIVRCVVALFTELIIEIFLLNEQRVSRFVRLSCNIFTSISPKCGYKSISQAKRKIDKFLKKLVDFGRSVIIGLGKIQSYQWFESNKQEGSYFKPSKLKLRRNERAQLYVVLALPISRQTYHI